MVETMVLLPAYEPVAEHLFPFLEALHEVGLRDITLVDDGSGPAYHDVFDRAANEFGCTILRHPLNKGKGAGLKTGIRHCAERGDVAGIITADADGQHAATDLAAVARELAGAPGGTVVLGCRDFSAPDVPPKSRFGNTLTTRVVEVLFGKRISDTQTGLRGMPMSVALDSTCVRGERFEYEMNVLLWLIGNRTSIVEVPIRTIYHDIDNSVTHFRPLRDSARIYAVIGAQFGRFVLASVSGAVIDLTIYALLMVTVFAGSVRPLHIGTAVVVARVVSGAANFVLNRKIVFAHDGPARPSAVRYLLLALTIMALSAIGSAVLTWVLGGHTFIAKVLTDLVLFVLSFLVQKRWVFAHETFEEES